MMNFTCIDRSKIFRKLYFTRAWIIDTSSRSKSYFYARVSPLWSATCSFIICI